MTQTETLELLVATLQQANSSQSESIERLTRQNEQLQNKLQELLAQVAWLNRQLFGRRARNWPIWIRTSYHCSIHLFSRWNTKYRKKPQPKNLSARRLPKESASEPQHVGWPSCSGDCHRTRRSRSG